MMRSSAYRLTAAVAAALVWVGAGSPAGVALAARAGGYNCKPDRVLDAPAQISVQLQSARRIHISATPGSDKSGAVRVESYAISGGGSTYTVPDPGSLYIDDAAKLMAVTVEGLRPGTRYSITATSRDLCGNQGASRAAEVTTGPAVPETVVPSLTTPAIEFYWALITVVPAVVVKATDDTAVARVQFFAGDTLVQDTDLSGPHWWADADAPPTYKWFISQQYRGTTQVMRVVATDTFGNTKTTTATFSF